MTEWFDKTQPIHIEIGSGMGQFITTLAAQNPHINYISMEREKSIVYKVLDKVKEMGLTNLKIICNDAIELNEYFKDGEVSRIYLNFSDVAKKSSCKTTFNVSYVFSVVSTNLK